MKKKALIGLCLVGILIPTAWGVIDSATETRYGLHQIPQPYNGRIRQLLGLTALSYKAIRSSGFKVYVLDKVIKQGFNKFYVWTDTDGGKYMTKHFMGPQQMFMKEGDAYVGSANIMWLTVYRDKQEVKFTIQR